MTTNREEIDVAASVSRGRLVLKRPPTHYVIVAIGFFAVIGVFFATLPSGTLARIPPRYLGFLLMCGVAGAALKGIHRHVLTSHDLFGDEVRLLQTARRAASSLGWRIVASGKNYIVAKTRETDFAWGQLVTIITQSNKVYLNSRNRSGGSDRASFSFGKHRRHLSALLALMRTSPLAPPTSAPHELIGRWRLVRSSDNVTRTSEMDIRDDGRLFYSVPMGKRAAVLELFYEVDGETLITDEPSAPHKRTTHFSFEQDGKLVIQTDDGRRTWFERRPSVTPAA